MRIVFLGPPGAGKGTQAARLAQALKLIHISTGDMLRAEVAAGSDLGKLAKAYMDRGELVPDDVIIGMIRNRLRQGSGMVLDGFPRTVAQAQALDRALSEAKSKIDRVIYFKADGEELVRRLSGRATCSKCQTPYNLNSAPPKKAGICDKCGSKLVQRDDDKPEAVRNRLKVYEKQTAPVLDYYRAAGTVHEINAIGTPDQVYARIEKAVK
jgi:adenylate kinase